jgi:hypothetical protein
MKRLCLIGLAALASAPSFAVGKLADVSVTDRDSGATLTAYLHRGEYWIAGRPGARYAINIRNLQGRRLLAVTSVDGVNVITGDTARSDQNGYVFEPWVGYDIAGWRKSDAQVAAFVFTAIPQSYAARTGRPDNVGVIGVALFREREAPQRAERTREFAPPSPAPAAGASNKAQQAESAARAPSPSLGTGHGQRESSVVTQVEFVRAQSAPEEVIRIRYDSRANLVAMGVIRDNPPAPRGPQAFPGEPGLGYVPDP